jgi:hypothetical protein
MVKTTNQNISSFCGVSSSITFSQPSKQGSGLVKDVEVIGMTKRPSGVTVSIETFGSPMKTS